MKVIQTFLTFIFILLSTTISAQYNGNGYGNGGYGRTNVNDGSSLINQPSQPEKPKEIPAEVTAAKLVDDLKPALNLDELQVIAITNLLKESLRAQGVLLKQDYSQEEQIKNLKILAETTDQKLNQFLSKEQKEKYIAYKEEKQNRTTKKEKSKSKSKEKKETQD